MHERVQHVSSNSKVLQVSRVDFVDRQDHGDWLSQRKNNLSLLGEILQVASLRVASGIKIGLLFQSSIDESCNLKVLFKPSRDSKLLKVDSFWLELHDHSNSWDSESSAFSFVLSNSNEDWKKLLSVHLSNITKSPEGNLSQLSGAFLGLSFQIADKKWKN